MQLLADTSALLALFQTNDIHHREAGQFVRRTPKARYILTDLIVSELATRLRAQSSAARAVAVTSDLLRSDRYQVLFADADLLTAALKEMAQFADERLSLADCASFVVIRRLGLSGAFTFDRDFRDCGLTTYP